MGIRVLEPKIGDIVVYHSGAYRVLGEVSVIFTSVTGKKCVNVTNNLVAMPMADCHIWCNNTGPSGPNKENLPPV